MRCVELENGTEVSFVEIRTGIESEAHERGVCDALFKQVLEPSLYVEGIVFFKTAAAEHIEEFICIVRAVVCDGIVNNANYLFWKRKTNRFFGFAEAIG